MGNICRSPAAEAITKKILEESNLDQTIRCESAGTISYHEGNPADPRMILHGAKRGYKIDSISRALRQEDFECFDYIVTMDEDNYREVNKRLGTFKSSATIVKICNYARDHHHAEVPDPYYGGDKGFDEVLDLLEDACRGFIDQLTTHIHNIYVAKKI